MESIELTENLPVIEGIKSKYEDSKLDPMSIFNFFFDESIFEMLTANTNKNMRLKTKSKISIFTKEEIKSFIFIHIFMSIYKYPQINLYWEDNILLSSKIKNVMSYNRFITLSRYFHISDYEEGDHKANRLLYINCLFNKLNKSFGQTHSFSSFLTIDESMASYQGVIHFKQYIKDKNRKWGIKFFALCDSTSSYVYKLIPYTGKQFSYDTDKGIGPSVAGSLLTDIKAGTHISFDSFFTSFDFLKELHRKGFFFTGTFLPTKKCFQRFRDVKLKQDEVSTSEIEGVTYMVYHNKRMIYMASNKYSAKPIVYLSGRKDVKKVPEMIYVYNKTKSGVDGVDQITSIYSSKRKTYKWWKAVFFYLLDTAIANSSVIFYSQKYTNDLNINSKMLYYRKSLCDSYFSSFILIDEVNLLHCPIELDEKKDCDFCLSRKRKNQKHIKQTKFGCTGCSNIPLCVRCFIQFHNNYYKQ